MAVYLNSLLLETTLPNKSKIWAQLSAQLAFESNLCMAVPGREAAGREDGFCLASGELPVHGWVFCL